ncbi:unnamed protein product [Prorocentrum cordatum]|uniref:Uncharacterized protein n=1 Tax=Prorocentrum cordatum TaxID=2364126 RepID=A0ABN9TNN0_9DINO|nr:unnamed protein product [Polarella glacialis]
MATEQPLSHGDWVGGFCSVPQGHGVLHGAVQRQSAPVHVGGHHCWVPHPGRGPNGESCPQWAGAGAVEAAVVASWEGPAGGPESRGGARALRAEPPGRVWPGGSAPAQSWAAANQAREGAGWYGDGTELLAEALRTLKRAATGIDCSAKGDLLPSGTYRREQEVNRTLGDGWERLYALEADPPEGGMRALVFLHAASRRGLVAFRGTDLNRTGASGQADFCAGRLLWENASRATLPGFCAAFTDSQLDCGLPTSPDPTPAHSHSEQRERCRRARTSC